MIRESCFQFKSSEGVTPISAKFWVKEDAKPRAILQIVHGMVEYKARYDAFASYMAEAGYFVVAHDHLGHGDSVLSEERWGYMTIHKPSHILVKDMNRVRRMAQKKYPDLPYIMLGHSMGSFLLRQYLTVYGEGLAGAIIMGTGFMGQLVPKAGLMMIETMGRIRGWNYRSQGIQNMTYSEAYQQYDLTGADASRSWLTKDEEIVKKYYSDPKCTYTFTLTGHKALMEAVCDSADPKLASKIDPQLPLFFVSGAEDPVGNLGKGVAEAFNFYEKLGHQNMSMKLYEGDRHEILNELDRETVYEDICNWIENNCI